jgi:Uma2 family endonuclease
MPARIKEHATYEDLLRVPENMVAELIEGELYTWPRPRGTHGRAAANILTSINIRYGEGGGGIGGWWIIGEPEVHFREQIVVPDIGGWRVTRMPLPPSSHVFDIAPDWICEVLSPRTKRIDWSKKLALYGSNGVPRAWYVDVDERQLQVMQLVNGEWVIKHIHSGNDVVRAEPFPDAEIDLKWVWGIEPEE